MLDPRVEYYRPKPLSGFSLAVSAQTRGRIRKARTGFAWIRTDKAGFVIACRRHHSSVCKQIMCDEREVGGDREISLTEVVLGCLGRCSEVPGASVAGRSGELGADTLKWRWTTRLLGKEMVPGIVSTRRLTLFTSCLSLVKRTELAKTLKKRKMQQKSVSCSVDLRYCAERRDKAVSSTLLQMCPRCRCMNIKVEGEDVELYDCKL